VLCRALVPLVHLSDLASTGVTGKYKEGQKVTGRVLECDPAGKRINLSLKKLLKGEKLPPFSSWEVRAVHLSAAVAISVCKESPFLEGAVK
jgi:rRNA biogenesis protein RRP5